MGANEPSSDPLIEDYLRELRVSAWNRRVPRPQAANLENEVRASIDAELAEAGDRDVETVLRVLDRLGPPSAFVADLTDAPPTESRRLIDTLMTPITRVRGLFEAYGWGWADIGALLLLIAGPFYLWWIGPIFGIILVRAAANRWAPKATHRATAVVVWLFAAQVIISVGLFVIVLAIGGPLAEQLQRIFSNFALGGAGRSPLAPGFGGDEPLSPVQLLMASPAYVAGGVSGVYLALSPRYRPEIHG